ncbi:MAG: class I SAM-dependent methyltransferase, partial [Pseudonocardia sp.]|nr:class I SAM-dependent methyltransferase [Pseudonocardia sp.]
MRFDPSDVPDQYDADYYVSNGQSGDRPALRWYVQMVRRYIGPGPYLDFGCGTGHLVRRLGAVGSVSGFEISPYSVATARRTAPGCEIHTALEEIPDGRYRGLTAVHVLEHLDDDTAADVLACWRRVLRPGGRALVVMPDPAGKARRLAGEGWTGYQDRTHINLKPHAEWRAFLEARGFRVLREGSDGLWNVPYGRAPKLLDAGRYAVPALAQWASGRLFLRPGRGESAVFVLESVSCPSPSPPPRCSPPPARSASAAISPGP